jgi:hypothetical protein
MRQFYRCRAQLVHLAKRAENERQSSGWPPWVPEKAMLVDGVTIDGGDCPAGFCATLACANNHKRWYGVQSDRSYVACSHHGGMVGPDGSERVTSPLR